MLSFRGRKRGRRRRRRKREEDKGWDRIERWGEVRLW